MTTASTTRLLIFAATVLTAPSAAYCLSPPSSEGKLENIAIEIDARNLPRRLLHAKMVIPVPETASGKVALWYPKWVPGSHGPGGPIANLAGLRVEDSSGSTLPWIRTPGEVYRIEVNVPNGVARITIHVTYIANQPTTNSMGHDVFGSSLVGIISPGAVLFYREGMNIDETAISTRLILPKSWTASTALEEVQANGHPGTRQYAPSTLRTFVDSPIMCGRYRRVYSLSKDNDADNMVLHRLHVFSESESAVNLASPILDRLKAMVTQTAKLMGSHPFDRFEILLACTDQLPANGLEHARSTLNVLPRSSLESAGRLKGWNRLLIPHEYLHSWCGKYRRPNGMFTTDFHTPKDTELLWVYEGLTQYLGELVEARCGLMSADEFRHRLGVELRNASHQQNRHWRPLVDTAAASHVLRSGSASWSRLRGSQDYYMEGMLLWLEIDALLRTKTKRQKSLDDFCQTFFAANATRATAISSTPRPFDRNEIVNALNNIAEHDWDGLIRRRVESTHEILDPSLAGLLGYEFGFTSRKPSIPASTFRYSSGFDEYDSIGAVLANDGTVTDILLGSAADDAKLGPGMKIVGVNGRTWSARELLRAIVKSSDGIPMKLLVSHGDELRNVQIQYYDGPRYLALTRDDTRADLLREILEPR